MKVSNLSLAVFMALGVIACGGSGNGNVQTVPDDKPAPAPDANPAPEQPSTPDSTLVDPTQTHVVDNRDLLKESTVGSLQYIRREGSEYDRIANPGQRASSTPLLGVSLDEQNPKLTNIVLARQELERADGVPVKAQFAGGMSPEPLTREGKPQAQPSLQAMNFENVDILAGAFKQFGSAKTHTDGTQIPNNTNLTNDKATNIVGDQFDYDTHTRDNWENNEFTRERVSHVYTLRKEYLQPYVDYPHIKVPTDANHRIAPSGSYPQQQYANNGDYVEPVPGYKPSAHDMLTAAGYNKGKYLDNYFSWDNARKASHDPNNGLGVHATITGPTSGGVINNNHILYGTLDNATWQHTYTARNWKNKPTDTDALAVGHTWVPGTATTPGHYTRGDTANHGNPDRDNYANYDQATLDWTRPSIMGRYPDGGYPRWTTSLPRYPNETYDNRMIHRGTGGAGTAANEGKAFYDNPLYNHEHTYLEEDEFTAIREGKPVRPLRNPKANTWEWPEYTATWSTTYTYEGYYTTKDNLGNVTKHPVARATTTAFTNTTKTPTDVQAIIAREGKALPDGYGFICPTGADCSNVKIVEIASAHITSGNWTGTPTNLQDGVQGEFRGGNYDGYNEGAQTIRYSDERIWKAGAPGYKPEYERKYGANLIWWSTQDSAFENWATREGWDPRARRVDNNMSKPPEDLERSLADARDEALEIQPTGDITNGLVRIGGNRRTLGEEMRFNNPAHTGSHAQANENPYDATKAANQWYDHHNTKTRIFGRYHLAYADQGNGEIERVTFNSYQGARSFVARTLPNVESAKVQWGNGKASHRFDHRANLDNGPEAYSIGAIPMTLEKVQYGRVSNNLDLENGEGPFDGGFLHSPFRSLNVSSYAADNDGSMVHNYFYRGVDATSIDQMTAVTANNGMARYEGHALMYGIDNRYLGYKTRESKHENVNLPNAFALEASGNMDGYKDANDGSLGFGNFVQADVNFGTKKVTGEVYNAWLLSQWVNQGADGKLVKDLKVQFEGDIMGNTVIGTADRIYLPGNDKADFRASFFGSQAEEMGGSFNSVTREEKYGSAYEDGDWGGVFGAKKVGAGNTFQGDDGANVYSGQ